MDTARYIDDLNVMIPATYRHLADALERGDRTDAHRYVDEIIDCQRKREDLRAATAVQVHTQ